MRYAALAAIGPLMWVVVDFAVTGAPAVLADRDGRPRGELGRDKGVAAVPAALYAFLIKLDKFPVFFGGAAGLVLAVALTPRRALMPLALFGAGAGTFAMVGIAGLSVIDRYLLVPSLMRHDLRRGRARRLDDAARGQRLAAAVGGGRGGARDLRRRLHRHAR